MTRALIGHTGFVGSNLSAQGAYNALFNSRNIEEMRGHSFDEVVCCGVSAVKWQANKEPERDWDGIVRLLETLEEVRTRRFVLISTIDVYPDPSTPLDESAELGGLDNHAYGRHRLAVERFVSERFDNHLIVRLPALFGPGLKKNALYDLMHGNQVEKINPAGVFQWYPLDRLTSDLERAGAAGLRLVNLFTEALAMERLVGSVFPGAPVGLPTAPAPTYRLRTRHADALGGRDGYLMEAPDVLRAIASFVAAETERARA